jgi:hypothetical protein
MPQHGRVVEEHIHAKADARRRWGVVASAALPGTCRGVPVLPAVHARRTVTKRAIRLSLAATRRKRTTSELR